jgi:hypothetical protein
MDPDVILTIALVGEAVLVLIVGLAVIHGQRHPGEGEMGPPPDSALEAGEERSPRTTRTSRIFEERGPW